MGRMIHGYPSIYAIGHREIVNLFVGPVVIEEKVDGSQFSFGLLDGDLVIRSKGQQIHLGGDYGMFNQAVASVNQVAGNLTPGWVYRGEYLRKPRHNTLAYARIPNQHIVIFDIEVGIEDYLTASSKTREAKRLGFETVPTLYEGTVATLDELLGFLERVSFLGGCKIEGFVVKNYDQFTREKKVAIGKYVSEAFKEVHQGAWKNSNPNKGDIIERLVEGLRTPARWMKAVQHLRDAGTLDESPRDIGALMKEVAIDTKAEEESAIKDALFEYAWPKIQRGIVAGLPDWYKRELAMLAFEDQA